MESDKNQSIVCSVTQCKYNYEKDDYCTLDKIMVGTHENDPTDVRCTDCNSFKRK